MGISQMGMLEAEWALAGPLSRTQFLLGGDYVHLCHGVLIFLLTPKHETDPIWACF